MNNFARISFAVLMFLSFSAFAAPVGQDQAVTAAKNWLAAGKTKLGADMDRQFSSLKSLKNDSGTTICHVVSLSPGGFVVMSADDLVEPVIAFSQEGIFPDGKGTPLADLLFFDLSERTELAQNIEKTSARQGLSLDTGPLGESKAKWASLIAGQRNASLPTITNPWVDPLLKTKWGQQTASGGAKACYNYFTPTGVNNGTIIWTEGSVSNYPCGCVATALAQIMRYYQYPNEKCEGTFNITVDNYAVSRELRAGTGSNGAFAWANMPAEPNNNTGEINLREIGTLTYDCGLSVNMDYTAEGSGSDTLRTVDALKNTFKYSNAIKGYRNGSELINNGFTNMCNPNLDAGRPCQLGLNGWAGGHSVVCDGYGYDVSPTDPNKKVLYHHLNMGWEGAYDLWYTLPVIDSNPDFSVIRSCVYNVYQSGSGEIISGRVATASGSGLNGVKMTAEGGGKQYTTYTNNRGIYYFEKMPSATNFTITCGHKDAPNPISIVTGTSKDNQTVGNIWGINFTVGGGPEIGYTPTTITLECAQGTSPSPVKFYVWNKGLDKVNFSIGYPPGQNWIACWPTSGTSASATDKQEITAYFETSTAAAGEYVGGIAIVDAKAANSPQWITVYLKVKGSSIGISTNGIKVACAEGQSPAPVTFQVWNAGVSKLDFAISDDATWLSCSPTSGQSTGITNKADIMATFSTSALKKGEYLAEITVSDTSGASAAKTIAVLLVVGPKIGYFPTAFSILTAKGADAPPKFFDLTNTGGGTLHYSISDDVQWVACSPASGTLEQGATQRITMDFSTAGLPKGDYSGTITISDANSINSPQKIPLAMTIIIMPSISLSTDKLEPTCVLGNNAKFDQFTVRNDNDESVLNYNITTNASWLTCSPTSGTSTGKDDVDTITVTYATSELPIGTYTATITVASIDAINSPQTIEVTLQVGPDESSIPDQAKLQVTLFSNTGGITRDNYNRVSFWPDFSTHQNDARQGSTEKQPIYLAALPIPKHEDEYGPVVYFKGKSLLEILPASTTAPATKMTTAMYFRTGTDVTTRQVLFKIGDQIKGMNAYLDAGNLYVNAWDLKDDDGIGPDVPWGPLFVSTPVVPDTTYTLFFLFDQANREIKGYLNGVNFGTAIGAGKLYPSKAKSSIGGPAGPTLFHDMKKGGKCFKGHIASYVHYGDAVLTTAQRNALSTYLSTTFAASFSPVNQFVLWIKPDNGIDKDTERWVSTWLDRSSSLMKFSQKSKKKMPRWEQAVLLNDGLSVSNGILFDGAANIMTASSSPNINSSSLGYSQRSMFIVFKTGVNISERQVVWTEGDKNTGLSLYIYGGKLFACAGDLKGKCGSVWGPSYVTLPADVNLNLNTVYCAEIFLNQPAGTLSLTVSDGTNKYSGSAAGAGILCAHPPAAIGGIKGSALLHDGAAKSGSYLGGYIFEILVYGSVLDAADTALVESYITGIYGIKFP